MTAIYYISIYCLFLNRKVNIDIFFVDVRATKSSFTNYMIIILFVNFIIL